MEEQLIGRAVEELMRREENLEEQDAQVRIAATVEYIKAYTHQEEIPEGLFYTLVDMAQEGWSNGDVEEITEGDTRIKYSSAGGMSGQYAVVLNRYRRMSYEAQ